MAAVAVVCGGTPARLDRRIGSGHAAGAAGGRLAEGDDRRHHERTHGPIVRRVLGDSNPVVQTPLWQAVLSGDAFDDVSVRAAEGLAEWGATFTAGEPDLVLRLIEPELDDNSDPDDDALWRLHVCLRPEGEAPERVRLHRADPKRIQLGSRKLEDAIKAYPRFRDVPRDEDSLDLLLPTPVVMDLVGHGAIVLRERGITLLLPRAWNVVSPSLRVRVTSAASPIVAENRTVGMDQLLEYDWELALGDKVLTAEEMTRLVDAKSDLVQLRGEWVQADKDVLARAARFVSQRHSSGDRAIVDLIKDLIADDLKDLPVAEVKATGWASALLDQSVAPRQVAVPSTVNATLRPYQRRGLDWLAYMSASGSARYWPTTWVWVRRCNCWRYLRTRSPRQQPFWCARCRLWVTGSVNRRDSCRACASTFITVRIALPGRSWNRQFVRVTS